MDIREATSAELPAVRNVLDGALLESGVSALDTAIADGAVLVPVRERQETADTVLGALVLDGEEIAAVAVRPRLRGQGIGTALVEAAAARRERLVAHFRAEVRPFWASLDFEIRDTGAPGRFRGQLMTKHND